MIFGWYFLCYKLFIVTNLLHEQTDHMNYITRSDGPKFYSKIFNLFRMAQIDRLFILCKFCTDWLACIIVAYRCGIVWHEARRQSRQADSRGRLGQHWSRWQIVARWTDTPFPNQHYTSLGPRPGSLASVIHAICTSHNPRAEIGMKLSNFRAQKY